MAEPDPIYDSPVSQPVTPPVEADEGYPEPPGLTARQGFLAVPADYPNKREAKIAVGVNYYDGATLTTLAEAEGGRWNDTLRMIYRAYQRFARFLFLHIGVVDWGGSAQFAADYDVEGSPTALMAATWEFDAANVAGGGNEKKVLLTWTASDPLLDHLLRASDGRDPSSVEIGDMVTDDADGNYGRAQIKDIEYHGLSGSDHTATLSLNMQLNFDRDDIARISRSNLPYLFPDIPLRYETAMCRHAIRRDVSTFSSYKAAYPSAYVADGIAGEWFCAKMDQPGAALDTFEAFHIDTDCPYYEENSQYVPQAYDVSECLLARGYYLKMVLLLGGSGDANFRKGIENFPGVLQLGGVQVGFQNYSNSLRPKDSLYVGIMRLKTGETTADGYTEFLNFTEQQENHVTAAEDETDAGTFLELFAALVPDKYDAAGGATSSARLLIDDDDRTPGNIFSQNMGVRRVMARKPGQAEMDPGLSYGDKGNIAGAGTAETQRVRHVRRTSVNFTKGKANTFRGETTTVDVYALPQTAPSSDYEYDILLTTSRFSDAAYAPDARWTKAALSGARAANVIFSGALVTIELSMKTYELSRPDADPLPDIIDEVKTGGGYVASEISHTITNPGEGDGVRYFTDPERLLYPGDVIAFDDDDVRGITLTCVSAKALSGSVDASAVAPNIGAPGVPEYVRDNYNKRDVGLFEITEQNGEVIRDFVTGIGASEQDIAIDWIAHGAVAPPQIDADEAATGYNPVLKKTLKATGATTTVPTSQYMFEPNTGQFFIDSDTWAAGDYVLHAEMWVFDAREIYPCELSSALAGLVDGLCEMYYKTSLDLTDADYELLIDSDSPETGISVHTHYSPLEVTSAPYVPFDLDDGLEHDTERNGNTITRTYMSPFGGSPFAVGCIPDREEPLNLFVYSNELQCFKLDALGDIGRWRADDIAEAFLEISLTDAVITEYWDDLTWTPELDPVEDSGSQTLSEIDLTITLFSKTTGTTYDLESTGISVETPTTIIDDGGTDYLRGSVNITHILKWLVENMTDPSIEYLFVVGAGAMPAGTLSINDLAKGWIDYFFSEREGDGDPPYNEGLRSRRITFDEVTIGFTWIKTDAAELENGSELPRTSDGLIVDNPDLTFEPV